MRRATARTLVISVVLLALPPVAVLAPHGVVVVFALAAVASLASLVAEGRAAWTSLRTDIAIVITLLLLWALCASFWSPDVGGSLRLWVSAALLFLGGLALLAATTRLSPSEAERASTVLCLAAILLLGLIAIELWSDNALVRWARELIRYQGDEVTVNNINGATTVLVVLAAPLTATIYRRLGGIAAVAFALGVLAVLPFAPMEAALTAAIVAGVVFALAYRWRRLVLAAAMAVIALGLVLAPLVPYGIGAGIGGDRVDALPSAWRHRILIWQFVADRIAEKPFFGWGFDAARNIPGKRELLYEGAPALPLHPHNGALQVWLELGLPGALIVLALGVAVLARLRRSTTPGVAAIGAAVFFAWGTFALVSFGVWHNWWLVMPWLAAAVSAITFRASPA